MRREVVRHKWMAIWESDDGNPFVTMTPSDGGGTMIVPVTNTGEILILREFSQAYAERVLFLSGGGIEEGEDAAESANRELQEEAGFKANRLDYLGEISPFQKYLRARICVYLGRNLVPSKLDSGEDADTTVERIRLSDVESLIETGKLRDSSVIAALFMARAFLEREKPVSRI